MRRVCWLAVLGMALCVPCLARDDLGGTFPDDPRIDPDIRLERLVERLGSDDPAESRAAVRELMAWGEGALPSLNALLTDLYPETADALLRARPGGSLVGPIQSGGLAVWGVLLGGEGRFRDALLGLDAEDPEALGEVCTRLAGLGREGADLLLAAYRLGGDGARDEVLNALREAGWYAAPGLIDLRKSESPAWRCDAIGLLSDLYVSDGGNPYLYPMLVRGLDDEDAEVRDTAARWLVLSVNALGAAPPEVVEAFERLAADEDAELSQWGNLGLMALRDDGAPGLTNTQAGRDPAPPR